MILYRLLGKIDQAYKDLGKGQGIDYDDDTDELQKSLKDDVSSSISCFKLLRTVGPYLSLLKL